ncbi:MAG TPA: hypothetical protein VGB98_25725 [Pyrinomonadaceae bacterium]
MAVIALGTVSACRRATRETPTTGGEAAAVSPTPEGQKCHAIVSYMTSAERLEGGQSATLSWQISEVEGAGKVAAKITDLLSGAETSVEAREGSMSVSPASSRAYRLTVSGERCAVTQDIVIGVNPAPAKSESPTVKTTSGDGTTATYQVQDDGRQSQAPPKCPVIMSFTVNRERVTRGEKVTLSWDVAAVERVTIYEGSKPKGWGRVAVKDAGALGVAQVTPSKPATYYTLVATRAKCPGTGRTLSVITEE